MNKMNKVLKILMVSDVVYFTGFGLSAPIVAIFLKENLTGGTIFAAGVATTIFILVKSVIQLPFSRYIDKHDNKLFWVKVGYVFIVLNPLIYIFADHINYIYLAEGLHGLGSGLSFPAWLGLWSTHLDKGHESFEWSLYSTLVGAGSAVTAGVGAAVAEFIGFNFVFMLVAALAFVSFFVLFFLDAKAEVQKPTLMHYHIKREITHNNKARR